MTCIHEIAAVYRPLDINSNVFGMNGVKKGLNIRYLAKRLSSVIFILILS